VTSTHVGIAGKLHGSMTLAVFQTTATENFSVLFSPESYGKNKAQSHKRIYKYKNWNTRISTLPILL